MSGYPTQPTDYPQQAHTATPQQEYPQQGMPAPQYEKQPEYAQQMPQQQQMPMQQQQIPMQHAPAPGGHQFQTAMPLAGLSRSPAPVDCPSCGVRALTAVSYESGDNAHLWALVFCCLLCAPCIPYIVKSFKDVKHCCGSCGVPLALWHKSGGVDVLLHA